MKYTEQNEQIINSWKEKYEVPWMFPISHEEFVRAANGEEVLTLTPLRKVPFSWYGDCKGKKVLGLAAGGGQQMAVLSARLSSPKKGDRPDLLQAEYLQIAEQLRDLKRSEPR